MNKCVSEKDRGNKTTISKRTREQNTCMYKCQVKRDPRDVFRSSRIPLRDKEKNHRLFTEQNQLIRRSQKLAQRQYQEDNLCEPEPGQSKIKGRTRMHWKTNPKSDQQPSDSVRRQVPLKIYR